MIRRILLFLFLAVSGTAFAQEPDYGIWGAVSGKYEFLKNLDAEFKLGLKAEEKLTVIDYYYFEPGLSFKFTKWLSTGYSYRLIRKHEDDGIYHNRHRHYFYIKGDAEAGRFAFSIKPMYQRTSRTYIEKDRHLIPEKFIRVKLQAEYDIKSSPVRPFISYEPYIPIDKGNGFEFEKTRYSAGADIKLSKNSRLEAGYLLEDYKKEEDGNLHVLSLEYKLAF
jgi:hypothetical protein